MNNEKQIGTENSVQIISSKKLNRLLMTLFSHLKEGVEKIVKAEYKCSNDDFISMGRNEKEKELIRECVEKIDNQYEFIEEIEKEGRDVDLEKWYKNTESKIMEDLSDEEKRVLSEIIIKKDIDEEKAIIDSTDEIIQSYYSNSIENSDLSQSANYESQDISSNIITNNHEKNN